MKKSIKNINKHYLNHTKIAGVRKDPPSKVSACEPQCEFACAGLWRSMK